MRRAAMFGLVLAAAGCLADPPAGAPPEAAFDPAWSERALAYAAPHDHADRAQHRNLSTANFELLGYDALLSPHYGGRSAGGYLCGDAAATVDGRRLAAVESRSEVGFAVADVSDPARPRWLGELVMSSTYVYDLAVVPDGRHLVLVTSQLEADRLPGLADPRPDAGLAWRTPCAPEPVPVVWAAEEDPLPRPMSLLLVSIADPARPTIIDQHPIVGYGHSAYSTVLDGRTWVLVTTAGPQTDTSAYEFYEIVATPGGARLAPLSVYKPPTAGGNALGGGGHDGSIAKHPGDGRTLAWLVGRGRFTVLDLGDLRQPREIGSWTDTGPGREGYSASLHSVLPLPQLRDGRHYTIIGPEFGSHPTDHPSGIIWVLDTTDPARPKEVAAWTLPHEVVWSGTYMFSNHYFSVHGDTLFVSMYHGGVWAVDLAPVGSSPFALLPSVGVLLPDRDPPAPAAVPVRWAPTVEEVLAFDDGSLVTFDSNSGLYAFRFDASRPAPAPTPWPIRPLTAS